MSPQAPETFGCPIKEISRICGVSERTARRWKDGTMCPPAAALILLRILFWKELDPLGPEWRGWRLGDGTLVSPDGWEISRNDALAVPLLHGQIQAMRQRIEGLEATHDALEEQPEPGELPAFIA